MTSVGAAVRGAVGGILGKAYEYTLQPAVDFADDMANHPVRTTKSIGKSFLDKFVAYGSDDPESKREARAREQAEKLQEQRERYSRRGFLGKIIYGAHRHPVGTGIAIGAGYSAAKGTIGYHTERKKAQRIETLEGEVETLRARVEELEHGNNTAPHHERKRDKGVYGSKLDMAIFGLALISGIFIMYFTGNITGFSVLGSGASLGALIPAVIAGMIIFVFSIVYILTRD